MTSHLGKAKSDRIYIFERSPTLLRTVRPNGKAVVLPERTPTVPYRNCSIGGGSPVEGPVEGPIYSAPIDCAKSLVQLHPIAYFLISEIIKFVFSLLFTGGGFAICARASPSESESSAECAIAPESLWAVRIPVPRVL